MDLLKTKASSFRTSCGIGASEAINLKSLLLKLNIQTLFWPLSDSFSGMSLKVNPSVRFILVNSNHVIGRQNFTIAHELYHLFIQDQFEPHACTIGLFDAKNKEEYQADLFAANLLMPEEGIADLISEAELKKGNLSINSVVKLEQYFSVSRNAILSRLRSLRLINAETYSLYKNQKVVQIARSLAYDISLYFPGNPYLSIGDYGEMARKLFDLEKISESHYMELMNLVHVDLNTAVDDCDFVPADKQDS